MGKADGGSLLVSVDPSYLQERGSLRAVRLLVGSAASNHAPEELVVCGKVVPVRTNQRAWSDVFLDS